MIVASVMAICLGVFTAVFRPAVERRRLKPGDLAPDFSLPGSDGQVYRLGDLAGSIVVLAWFPKAFTGGCTVECRSLGMSGEDFRRMRVRYFAASVDSAAANARFAESLGIDYPILSDPTREVARAYGVLGATGFPDRWTFYIGADGRILDIDTSVHTRSHGADVVEKLKALSSGSDLVTS
jgi:peroxiredoxin Q/BCP